MARWTNKAPIQGESEVPVVCDDGREGVASVTRRGLNPRLCGSVYEVIEYWEEDEHGLPRQFAAPERRVIDRHPTFD